MKKTVRDIDVKGKRVLVRCDFNVPADKNTKKITDENGKIIDNTRIVASLPTIKYLMEQGAKVILCSHLGRPKGKVDENLSLKPVAEELTNLLGTNVEFATDVTGDSAKNMAANLNDGEVGLLENVRFDPREEANDDTLSMELADLTDGYYVGDAFGTAHRAHASTAGVTKFLEKKDENGNKTDKKGEAVAGLLMEKEVEFLNGTLENPDKPFVAILGGAKVSDKIGVIENLLDKVDEILIGGGMAYTFLVAEGHDVGDSICEYDKVDTAKAVMKKAKEMGVKITLPKDVNVAKEFSNEAPSKIVGADSIPEGYQGLDIGPKTIVEFSDRLRGAETILWNGPLGVCEFENYTIGTEQVAEAIAQNEEATSIVGGGDSIAAIKRLNLEDAFSHISTGGGATLELLEGKEMPGIACLDDVEERGQETQKKPEIKMAKVNKDEQEK